MLRMLPAECVLVDLEITPRNSTLHFCLLLLHKRTHTQAPPWHCISPFNSRITQLMLAFYSQAIPIEISGNRDVISWLYA
jgi:hypothetical protein